MVVAFNTDANVNLKSDFAIEKKDVAQNQLGSRKFKAQNTLVESYANAKLEKLENKVDEKIKETENQSSWSRVYDAYLQAKKDIESGKAPLAVIRNLWDLNNTLLGEFHYSYSRLDLAVPDSDTKAAGDLWRTVMSIKNSPASALSILDERIAYVSNEVLKNQPQLVENKQDEAKVPEIKVPEKKEEAKQPETKKEETKAPEEKKEEIKAPEIKKPEEKKEEAKVPEIKVPEAKTEETKAPEENKEVPIKITEKTEENKAPDVKKEEKVDILANLTDAEATQVAPLVAINERTLSATTTADIIGVARDFCTIVSAYNETNRMADITVANRFAGQLLDIMDKAQSLDPKNFNKEVFKSCYNSIAKQYALLTPVKVEEKKVEPKKEETKVPEIKQPEKKEEAKVPEIKVPEAKTEEKKVEENKQPEKKEEKKEELTPKKIEKEETPIKIIENEEKKEEDKQPEIKKEETKAPETKGEGELQPKKPKITTPADNK